MFLALILGGLMVLVFVFLFGVESGAIQLTMTATVAGCIGLLIGLVVEFNAPYSGAIRVTPEAWTLVIDGNHFADVASGRLR
jgi:predicted lipid-binding transport protein (Tim44 family)